MLDARVLIANSEVVGAPSLATEGLNHPVVKALAHKMRVVALPARLWTCPGPGLVEAVRRLAEATRDLRNATAARRATPHDKGSPSLRGAERRSNPGAPGCGPWIPPGLIRGLLAMTEAL